MTTEREKMLAGELYDPLDPELVGGPRAGARPLPGAQRHARGGAGRAPAHPARAVRRGRRHGVDAAAVLLRLRLEHRARRARVLQLQLRRAGRVPGAHRRASRSSARPCRSTRRCTRSTPSCGGGKSSASRWRSARTCGWRRGDHPARRADRIARRHRRRQRGHARYSGRRVRGRQSLPGDPACRWRSSLT